MEICEIFEVAHSKFEISVQQKKKFKNYLNVLRLYISDHLTKWIKEIQHCQTEVECALNLLRVSKSVAKMFEDEVTKF